MVNTKLTDLPLVDEALTLLDKMYMENESKAGIAKSEHLTVQELVDALTKLPANIAALDGAADTIAVYDDSASVAGTVVINDLVALVPASIIEPYANGASLDTPDVTVASDGATITLTLEKEGGGDIDYRFTGVTKTLDCTPADTIALTAGSDTSPQINYVWVQIDATVATLHQNTTGFPTATEFAPVATVFCQSAATLQTDAAIKVHAWIDHISDLFGGHLRHMNSWIRHQSATWMSGVGQTWTITPNGGGVDNVDLATAAGIVLQVHDHAYPAFDTGAASEVYVINDNATPYTKITDFSSLLTDSLGNSMSASYFNLVVWGVVNEVSGDCKMFVNLPNGSYNGAANAQADTDRTAVYTIPSEYTGAGFLIARITLRHQTAASGTWTNVQEEDLRGLNPNNIAGGASGTSNEFSDNVFRVQDNGDVTKQLAFQISGVTTATTRTITMRDANVDFGNVLFKNETAVLTSGYTTTSFSLGTLSTATTLHLSDGQKQHATMGGSFTLTAPDDTDEGPMDLEFTIDGTGGYTLTLSGFNEISGTAIMTAGVVNIFRIDKDNTNTYISISQAV